MSEVVPGLREATLALNSENVKVFCINGVIVEITRNEAVKRLPYDVMEMQPLMRLIIEAQGREANFLSPMTSDQLLSDVGSGRELENINKDSVNMVAVALGGKEVFGPDQDGVLKDG